MQSVSPDTAPVEFRQEYEHELESWLRGRFGYLCIAYICLAGLRLAIHVAAMVAGAGVANAVVYVVGSSVSVGLIAAYFVRRKRYETREDVLRAATWMILVLGAISLAERFIVEWMGIQFASAIIMSIFFWHFTACLFLPWSPRESLQPILPLLLVWAIGVSIDADLPIATRLLQIVFSPGILLPGLLITAWRLRSHHRRFRNIMVGKQFRKLRQELSRARTIHESMFPEEYDDGHVRLQYTYEPMRELGGDFLHLHVSPRGQIHVTLLDVTGHGLAAALTVNRLYGEMERIRGESPYSGPGEVVTLLNRYVNLTMARHNIYATAVAICVDPYDGQLIWASAGHPPALVRGANGVVRHLESTAMMLGALDDDAYEAGEKTLELAPGDVVVAYTDGAIEARDRFGTAFGIPRLHDLMQRKPAPGNWPQFIAANVDRFKTGRAEDDVLVASITYGASRHQYATAQTILAET